MNNIAKIRREKGMRQIDINLDAGLYSKVENGRCLLPPKETLELAATLGTTVDKLYPVREEVVIPYPPSRKSIKQHDREQDNGIVKITLRVPNELASRFRELCKGHTQAEVFEIMVIKMEKTAALGQGQAVSEKTLQLHCSK